MTIYGIGGTLEQLPYEHKGNMTEQELREQIANAIDESDIDDSSRGLDIWKQSCLELAIQIIVLMEKAGYVWLSKDQSLPENPFNYEDECRESTSYSKGQHAMLKANFRKVELKEGTWKPIRII